MTELEITQNTEITVNYYEGVSDDTCERTTEKIVDYICEMLMAEYPALKITTSWNCGRFDGDYIITITEEGTVKYYKSYDWYSPDEWDEPTTLQEDTYEEVVKEIKTKYFSDDDIVASFNVNSDWEVGR